MSRCNAELLEKAPAADTSCTKGNFFTNHLSTLMGKGKKIGIGKNKDRKKKGWGAMFAKIILERFHKNNYLLYGALFFV